MDKPVPELIAAPEPLLRISAAEGEQIISLEWLNTAAGYYQTIERWLVAPELRFAVRAKMLAENMAEAARSDRREREFYKNAGEV